MTDVGIRRKKEQPTIRDVAEVLGWSCLVVALAYIGYLLHATLYTASLAFLLATVFATMASGAWAGWLHLLRWGGWLDNSRNCFRRRRAESGCPEATTTRCRRLHSVPVRATHCSAIPR